jgi:hypothetical protein
LHGFAYRCAAHSEPGHEPAFCGQSIARA